MAALKNNGTELRRVRCVTVEGETITWSFRSNGWVLRQASTWSNGRLHRGGWKRLKRINARADALVGCVHRNVETLVGSGWVEVTS